MSFISNIIRTAVNSVTSLHPFGTLGSSGNGHNNIDKLVNKTLDEVKEGIKSGEFSKLKLMDMPQELKQTAEQSDDQYLSDIKKFMGEKNISSISFIHTDAQGKISSVRTLELEKKTEALIQHKYDAKANGTGVDYDLNYMDKADDIEGFCNSFKLSAPNVVIPENLETTPQQHAHEVAPLPLSPSRHMHKRTGPSLLESMYLRTPSSKFAPPQAANNNPTKQSGLDKAINNKINEFEQLKVKMAPAQAIAQQMTTVMETHSQLKILNNELRKNLAMTTLHNKRMKLEPSAHKELVSNVLLEKKRTLESKIMSLKLTISTLDVGINAKN